MIWNLNNLIIKIIILLKNDIFSSAYSTAYYLKNVINFPKDKRVYVLGTKGLIKEIEDVGVNAFGYEVFFNFK